MYGVMGPHVTLITWPNIFIYHFIQTFMFQTFTMFPKEHFSVHHFWKKVISTHLVWQHVTGSSHQQERPTHNLLWCHFDMVGRWAIIINFDVVGRWAIKEMNKHLYMTSLLRRILFEVLMRIDWCIHIYPYLF